MLSCECLGNAGSLHDGGVKAMLSTDGTVNTLFSGMER